MDAVRYIEENLVPRAILDYYDFQQITETEDSIRACCRIHGGNNPTGFVWKKDNNLWFCYTGDCHGGDVFNLIQKIEHVDFITSISIAAKILGLNIDGMELVVPEERLRKEQLRWLEKQKRNKKVKDNVNKEYEIPYTKYFDELKSFTRFNTETLKHFNAKFCNLFPTENGMLKNKLMIPLIEGERCIGVALRDTTGTYFPKWFYQPKGISLNNVLYNFDEAVKQDANELILVEGIFDVWAYYNAGLKNAVAVFGSSVSTEQYKKILRTGKNIVLSFDNDNAGHKCTKKAIELFHNKTEVTIVNLPEGKDPADCTKEELLSAYLNRTKKVQE